MKIKRRKWTQYELLTLLHAHSYRCAYCRNLLPPEVEIDHIIPLSASRWREYDERTAFRLANHTSNIQPLCPNCHAKKSRKEQSELKFIAKRYQAEYFCLECKQTSSKYFHHHCQSVKHPS